MDIMDITVCNEQVFCFKPKLSLVQAKECAWDKKTNVFASGVTGLLTRPKTDEAQEKAWDKKTDLFGSGVRGLFNRSAGILTRPKPEDIRITDYICRYEPFWHITCNVLYVYDRTCDYNVPIERKDVKSVTIEGNDCQVMKNPHQFTVTVVEHCREEGNADIIYDAVSGQERKWKEYLRLGIYETELVDDLSTFAIDGSIVVVPEISATTAIHKALHSLFKSIKFMKMIEQKAIVSKADLYFRPVYAYEYEWVTMGKTAVAEFDGLTGEMLLGEVSLSKQVQKAMNSDLIFDVSQEAANLLVPGGGIAVRVIKEFSK